MKTAICRKCGKLRKVEAGGYCAYCYPYDESTDRYKQHKERRGKVNGKDIEV